MGYRLGIPVHSDASISGANVANYEEEGAGSVEVWSCDDALDIHDAVVFWGAAC